MYYYGARWYDPSIGRFISQDPFAGRRSNPQSLNPYIYVLDTPTSLTDPSGENPWYIDLLESLGPENDVINIAEHITGVNFDQLAGTTGGSQAQDLLTASRVLSGGAFLASGIVAAGAIIAPALGFGGSTALGVCEEDPQACDPPTPTEPTPPTITSTTGEGASEINPTELTTVRHYTSWVGRAGITQSGVINPSEDGFVYVTTPSEVEGLTTPQDIGMRLGIPAEKAVTYFEFQYPSAQLENLGLTSGGAQQLGILGRVFLSQVGGIWWPAVPQ